jgi:ATP-binding cassette subfamily B protein
VALVDLTQHVARLEEAIGTLLLPHELPDRPDAMPLRLGLGRVEFDHVRFAYPDRATVLRDFDLVIEPGQRVGLVGHSGAGKSTALALLQRFYDIQGGRILVDGQDIRTVTQESLRQEMAIVPQDISLFHRSVLENIRYARPEATEQEVLRAAEMAHCRDFIEAMPDGFATVVGDRGVKLSGGQRQRLAIARALALEPKLLVFDEILSNLDLANQEIILQLLNDLQRARSLTYIHVCHDLRIVSRIADEVAVMHAGRIVEQKPATELFANPGDPYTKELFEAMPSLETIAAGRFT